MEKSVGYFFYIIPFIPLSHKDIQMGYLLMYSFFKTWSTFYIVLYYYLCSNWFGLFICKKIWLL